jgi:hypothetical protein
MTSTIQKGTKIFIAKLSTRNFDFTSIGSTELEARSALMLGLVKHNLQIKVSEAWWSDDDINVDVVPVGGCIRDHQLL